MMRVMACAELTDWIALYRLEAAEEKAALDRAKKRR